MGSCFHSDGLQEARLFAGGGHLCYSSSCLLLLLFRAAVHFPFCLVCFTTPKKQSRMKTGEAMPHSSTETYLTSFTDVRDSDGQQRPLSPSTLIIFIFYYNFHAFTVSASIECMFGAFMNIFF